MCYELWPKVKSMFRYRMCYELWPKVKSIQMSSLQTLIGSSCNKSTMANQSAPSGTVLSFQTSQCLANRGYLTTASQNLQMTDNAALSFNSLLSTTIDWIWYHRQVNQANYLYDSDFSYILFTPSFKKKKPKLETKNCHLWIIQIGIMQNPAQLLSTSSFHLPPYGA